mmetsp:Transcript_7686/g.19621  ORF Transcript_7686/g.19621 Transcript_7686/m.19621 type:complete len:90 (-) Transcript_7686:53-322(-)
MAPPHVLVARDRWGITMASLATGARRGAALLLAERAAGAGVDPGPARSGLALRCWGAARVLARLARRRRRCSRCCSRTLADARGGGVLG